MAEKPLISIITVCFNAENSIEETITSVLSQTYDHIEYIVIDGKSTDGTLAVVEKYEDSITRVVSEPDSGIFDAMNKGINKSTGDIIYFLNADDSLFDNTVIETIAAEFIQNPAIDIIYGKVEYTNIPKEGLKAITFQKFKKKNKIDILIHSMLHQSLFAKRKVFDEIRLFNIAYKIYADYDWILRCFNAKINMKYVDYIIAYYNCQGRGYQVRRKANIEKIKIALKYSSPFELLYYFCYAIYRFITRKLNTLVI